MVALSLRRRRSAVTVALLAALVPATVAFTAAPAAAALPTCTTSTETAGGALVPAFGRNIDCTLQRGDNGDGVKRLQQTLVECYQAEIARDGVFGARTEAALVRVQSSVGTTADGVYGPATRRAMKHPYLGDSPCGRLR